MGQFQKQNALDTPTQRLSRRAGGFGFPTGKWMDVCAGNEGMKLGFSAQPRLVVFGGGLPIRVGGELVGGIGVSGASEEQDGICAQAGLLAIGADEVEL